MKTIIPQSTGDGTPPSVGWFARTTQKISNALACRESSPPGARRFPRAIVLASALAGLSILPGISSALAQSSPLPAPLSWWRAEGNFNDAMGLNNGSGVNNPGFAPGKVGQAFVFDGSSQLVRVPNAANFSQFGTSVDFTVAAWIKLNRPQNDFAGIFANSSSGGIGKGYQLVVVSDKIAAEFTDGSQYNPDHFASADPNWGGLIGTTDLNDGQWHYVAMVVTRSSHNVKIYVDGNVEVDKTLAVIGDDLSTTADIHIGCERNESAFFGGEIDEVKLYNVALSASQIADSAASQAIFTRTTSNGEGWNQYTATFTPTASRNYTLGFNITACPGNRDSTIFLDDVHVTGTAGDVFTSGFETPAISANTDIYPAGGNGTVTSGDWAFTDYSGVIFGAGFPGSPGSAEQGSQYGFVQAYNPTDPNGIPPVTSGTAVLSRIKSANSFALTAGQSYTATFWQASRSGPIGDEGVVTYMVTIDSVATPPPTITSATTANGGYGSAFSYQITATGSPTSYGATGLPAGLSVDASGLISGKLTSAPGAYTISLSASNAGGTGTATLTLTEAPAPLTVTANNATRVYGDANPAFTVTFSGFVNGDTAAVISGSPSFTTSATPSSSVGVGYSIIPAVGTLSAANYSFGPFINGALTVTPAPLTVTANNAKRMYGVPNPILTGTITGIKNNDPISALYSTTATLGSFVGTYPITISLVDSNSRLSNYTVTENSGTLTITPAPLTVAITAPPPGYLAQVNSPIDFAGSFTKSGYSDNYPASWLFQSATYADVRAPATIAASAIQSATLDNSISFAAPGLYVATLTVSDASGQSVSADTVNNQLEYVAVVDPSAGFLTGGGWVNVAPGMIPDAPTAAGKGHFEADVKYDQESGKLKGHLEFEFNGGDDEAGGHSPGSHVPATRIHFRATGFDWLAIQNGRADLKGAGTVNQPSENEDEHGQSTSANPPLDGFFLTAIAGHGKEPGRLRLFIWNSANNATVFDNQAQASIIDPLGSQTVLGGGAIVIHKRASDGHSNDSGE